MLYFLRMMFVILILIKINWIYNYAKDPINFEFTYLPIFIGIAVFLISVYLKNSKCKINKIEKFVALGKRVKSGEIVNYEDCPICLDEMKKVSNLAITNCCHVFHIGCINNWRNKNNECPICRTHICMERELPVSKKAANLFNYGYYKNSFSNLQDEKMLENHSILNNEI